MKKSRERCFQRDVVQKRDVGNCFYILLKAIWDLLIQRKSCFYF